MKGGRERQKERREYDKVEKRGEKRKKGTRGEGTRGEVGRERK